MSEALPLKAISTEGIPKAVEKAEHYRLLNDPEQAESICLDVLAVDPDNQRALRVLVLAMTDLFASSGRAAGLKKARAYLMRARSMAYGPFREAMESYEKAERIRPPGNDDAVLRWNSCLRTILREGLEPRADERELPLE